MNVVDSGSSHSSIYGLPSDRQKDIRGDAQEEDQPVPLCRRLLFSKTARGLLDFYG